MPHLIEVEFKGNRKEFFLWERDDLPPIKAAVIVDADRGEDLGRVHATGAFAQQRFAGVPHGSALGPTERRALRLATTDEVRRAAENAVQNEDARRRGMERVRAHSLVMKLTDAEWQWDRKKLTFYFTAEKRVDFRQLVRDLAAMFRARIELKQIGVRDEAKRLDGIGRCGRQYCSASWLPELRPVNLGVAKDQRLSLNPSQISGACGRLMCSLRYEHDFYVQSRKRFPKEGRVIVTARGEEKIVANDIFNDRVTLRTVEGDTRVINLADLRRELADLAPESAAAVLGDAGGDERAAAGAAPGAAPGGEPLSVAAVLSAAAAADDEVPVSLAPDGDEPRPPRPLREPDRRAGTPATDLEAAAPPDVADQEDDDDDESPAGTDTTATESAGEERRPRRRRGRRGGRRGRGSGHSPTGGSAGAPDSGE